MKSREVKMPCHVLNAHSIHTSTWWGLNNTECLLSFCDLWCTDIKHIKKKPMLAVLPRGCEHHARSCTMLAVYTACCQSLWVPSIVRPSSLCFVHYCCECSPQVSRWSSDSQGDSWHGLKVERVPSSSPLCDFLCWSSCYGCLLQE